MRGAKALETGAWKVQGVEVGDGGWGAGRSVEPETHVEAVPGACGTTEKKPCLWPCDLQL